MRRRATRPLTDKEREFYAGFSPMVCTKPEHKPLAIGDRVVIRGDHPHNGKSGVIEGVYDFPQFTEKRTGVKIAFDGGDGCFVFQPCKLERCKEQPDAR